MEKRTLIFPRQTNAPPFEYTVKPITVGGNQVQNIYIILSHLIKSLNGKCFVYAIQSVPPDDVINSQMPGLCFTPDIPLEARSNIDCQEYEACKSLNGAVNMISIVTDEVCPNVTACGNESNTMCDGPFACAPTRPLTVISDSSDGLSSISCSASPSLTVILPVRNNDRDEQCPNAHIQDSKVVQLGQEVIPLLPNDEVSKWASCTINSAAPVVERPNLGRHWFGQSNSSPMAQHISAMTTRPPTRLAAVPPFVAREGRFHPHGQPRTFSLRTHRGYIVHHTCVVNGEVP